MIVPVIQWRRLCVAGIHSRKCTEEIWKCHGVNRSAWWYYASITIQHNTMKGCYKRSTFTMSTHVSNNVQHAMRVGFCNLQLVDGNLIVNYSPFNIYTTLVVINYFISGSLYLGQSLSCRWAIISINVIGTAWGVQRGTSFIIATCYATAVAIQDIMYSCGRSEKFRPAIL